MTDLRASWEALDQSLTETREQRETAYRKITAVRELHTPAQGGRSGWVAPGEYGPIDPACSQCGSHDLAVSWPCPTIRALDAIDHADACPYCTRPEGYDACPIHP